MQTQKDVIAVLAAMQDYHSLLEADIQKLGKAKVTDIFEAIQNRLAASALVLDAKFVRGIIIGMAWVLKHPDFEAEFCEMVTAAKDAVAVATSHERN